MKWRVYKHFCRFQHNVEDNPNLVDKGCLEPHKHGFDPNPPCVIEFIIGTDKWIDFKLVKTIAIKCVESIANDKLNPDQYYPADGLPFYEFGTLETEQMVDDLKKLFITNLPDEYKPCRVQIWMDETKKYSMWDDGLD